MQSLIVSIPHSGERVPDFCSWLKGLPEEVLMCDVDRYVDFLYEDSLQKLSIAYTKTQWHRYAADLNRVPEDIDRDSVEGNPNPSGKFDRGFHWTITTQGTKLMKNPMPLKMHQELVELVYKPFHQSLAKLITDAKKGQEKIYHLDVHSMPSLGTKMHRDPGELRADIVVSDSIGKSSCPEFVDLVISSYTRAGFKVGYNWPYVGGRLTEQYGKPDLNHHTVQVELNRSLYMNEATKLLIPEKAQVVKEKINKALMRIAENLKA